MNFPLGDARKDYRLILRIMIRMTVKIQKLTGCALGNSSLVICRQPWSALTCTEKLLLIINNTRAYES